jgi:hypothetical protein
MIWSCCCDWDALLYYPVASERPPHLLRSARRRRDEAEAWKSLWVDTAVADPGCLSWAFKQVRWPENFNGKLCKKMYMRLLLTQLVRRNSEKYQIKSAFLLHFWIFFILLSKGFEPNCLLRCAYAKYTCMRASSFCKRFGHSSACP